MKVLTTIAIWIITPTVFAAGISVDPATGIDMGNTKITSLSEPQQSSDAATKGYVDGLLSAVPAPLPKTGQTLCHDEAGTEIACASTGQDGDLERGIVWPHPRFIDNLDGTVSDKLTGLIWLQNANCDVFFPGDTIGKNDRTWKDALTAANSLATGSCGLTDGSSAGDWHLPNYRELFSLIDAAYVDPALSNAAGTGQWTTDSDAFSGVQSDYYLSSTSLAGSNTSYAWMLDLNQGFVTDAGKTNAWYVWPVKGGQ